MRYSPRIGTLLTLVIIAGCDTAGTQLLEPDATRQLIQDHRDAAYAGSGVFLLPPISDNTYTRTAPFDLQADPRVEICRLDVSGALTADAVEAAACQPGTPAYWYETDASHDGVTFVEVTPEPGASAPDSLFSVNWKTDAADVGVAFRGTVSVPSLTVEDGAISVEYLEAARFDVVLYDNSSAKLDPARVVGFTAGKAFPLKFIVEEEAGCDGLDCFAFEVTCEVGVYQTEHAGALMPEDWAAECDVTVPGPERSWWLFQQRLPAGTPCPPGQYLDGIPYEPCYVWQLVEELDGQGDASTFAPYTDDFAVPATIQFCNNPVLDGGVPDALVPLAGIFRYSTNPGETPPYEVAVVPDAAQDALAQFSCPYDGPLTVAGLTGLGAFTHDVVRPALELLGLIPGPLYAGDTGTLSGKTIRMSHFQRVVELVLEAETDLAPAVILGGSTELGIRLTSPSHGDPLDDDHAGVPGIDVQYEVVVGEAWLAADGATACPGVTDGSCILVTTSLNDSSTPEDEGGYATATITIGGVAGTVAVEVTVPADPDMAPLTFGVEAVDLAVTFLEPLDKTGDVYGPPDERFEPVIRICAEGATPCSDLTAVATIPTADIKVVEENGRKFYQAEWKPRDTGTGEGGTYFAQVIAEGATVGYSIPIVVTKGGKSERVEDVYYNGVNSSVPLKFTITRVDPPTP